MPRILIGNIDNENMLADERALTDEFRLSSSLTAGRMSWFARSGDIVVLPRDLSPEFKAYIARVMGYESGAVTYILPEWGNDHFRPLGSNELLHRGIIEQLSKHIETPQDWSLYPYCYERGVHLLAEALRLNQNQDVRPFMKQGGAELLNDKRIFRSLAAGRGISVAEGTVCTVQHELERAITLLIEVTGAVIVKQDRHSGGLGNLIVSLRPDVSGQGALQVYLVGDDAPLAELARLVWERLAYLERAPLVVEVYYSVTVAVTAEFRTDPLRNGVSFLNCGEVRQAPILSGLIMPLALPAYQSATFIAGATELARLYCDMGYEGLINVDGIVTVGGKVIYNEVNGRVGGCSHIHHILETIAGPGYGNKLVVASHSRSILLTLEQVIDLLDARRLNFDSTSGRGIILTGENATESGFLEYLSIAPSREDTMRLETEFESILVAEGYEERRGGIEHLAKIVAHLTAGRPAGTEVVAQSDRNIQENTASKN